MKCMLVGAAILTGFVLGTSEVMAQRSLTTDTVYYLDRAINKEVEVTGTIEDESPKGIKIMVRGKGVLEIAALDVRHVGYKTTKVSAIEYRAPFFSKEERALKEKKPAMRSTLLKEALELYKNVDKELKDHPFAHRYLQYRIANCLVLEARSDPTRMDAAMAALATFKTDFPAGWEVIPALEQLARLQELKGDTTAAQKSYEELAEIPGIPPQMKQKSELLVARLLLRANKYDDAARKLETVQKTIKDEDPQKAYVTVYLIQCQMGQGNLNGVEAKLKATLRASTDEALKGLAHNFLGDYYSRKGQKEDAFWEYLKVDLLHNKDREEQAKALYNLARLFDDPKNDLTRAEQCRERLMSKQFEGTAYQRLAALDKKTPTEGK